MFRLFFHNSISRVLFAHSFRFLKDIKMYKGKPETVHETVERVMRENGYLSNPQTLQTDIGNFTWYNESQPQNEVPTQTAIQEQYQITMPKQEQYYITSTPPDLQKYSNRMASYIDNVYDATKNISHNWENSNFNGVPTSAISGLGEGIFGGLERFADGLTGGIYGEIIDTDMNNAYTDRQRKLQNRADQAGVGNLNKLTNHFIDVDAALMNYYSSKK